LVVVSLFLAGLLPPSIIMIGNALTEPSIIASWVVRTGGGPGANPTVVGSTEIDFRMMWEQDPQVTVDVTYYILNTATGTRVLRDQAAHSIGGETQSSIAVDIDGDGAKEIIAATPANTLKCMYRNGTAVWTKTYGTYDMVGCPSLYDLDGDGKYEVIFGRWANGGTDQLVVLNAEDGTVNMTVPLEPATSQAHDHPHVIGDVDNDGAVEIVLLEPPQRKIKAISSTGVVKWEATLPASAGKQSPIMGDFDADGEVEVAQVTDDGRVCYFSGSTGSLKKTVATGLNVAASLVAGDINRDGYLEVIVTGVGTKLVAIDRYGNRKDWLAQPSQSRIATPAIADLDGDGWPEVVAVDNAIRVFDWSGQIFSRAPGSDWANLGNAPVVFDCDADGYLDVVYFMTSPSAAAARLYKVGTTTLSSQKKWVTYKNDFLRTGIYGSDAYGVNPDLTLSNRNWSYGNVSMGSIAYKDFSITNVGQATLSGSCSGQAKISLNDTSVFSLNPGTSKGFRAYFDTSAQGIQTGFLIITTNDPDEPKLNITCTANVTQPLHDIAAYAIHVANQLNPNYVNDPPVKVEFKNLGSFWEGGITANLTINGILCANLTPRTFSLNPGQAVNVTFYWDRSNPALAGEGIFTLRAAAQNVNVTLEANTLNNVITKTVEVKYPLRVLSATTLRALNLTSYTPTDSFTEGDVMSVRAVIQNQWSVPVTFITVINVEDVTGAPAPGYGGIHAELTLAGGAQATVQLSWWLGLNIGSQTKYNATVYAYDKLGAGVRILAAPYVHTFFVQPS